jgi:hypothetical protein
MKTKLKKGDAATNAARAAGGNLRGPARSNRWALRGRAATGTSRLVAGSVDRDDASKRAEFPALVAAKRGPLALAEEPGVIVGPSTP